MAGTVRIAVLTTRDLVRHGLRGMLTALPMPVEFTDRLDCAAPADLVVVDATGTSDAGAQGLEQVVENESAPVIVLTAREDATGFAGWASPARAFVSVTCTEAQLVDAVAEALRSSAATRAAGAVASPGGTGLSRREVEVLTAIAAGRSNKDISTELFLGVNTVKTYIRTAYRKIDVESRSHAILWALGHGLGPGGVAESLDAENAHWRGADPD